MSAEFINLFTNVGFPIAVAACLMWWVMKITDKTRDEFLSRENKLLEANKQFAEALTKSSVAIADATKQHEEIIRHIHSIDCSVVDLHIKFEECKRRNDLQ